MKEENIKKLSYRAPFKVQDVISFTFAQERNAHNVALALAGAGYFVNICNTSSGYIVRIISYYHKK